MKDERPNLNAMIIALKFIMSYANMGLDQSFQNIFLIHAFFRACQYVIVNEKQHRILNKKNVNLQMRIYKST